MIKRNAKIIFLFTTLLLGCGKPLPTLEGIDLKQWKEDRNGCSHFREKLIDKVTSQKDKLLGLSEDDVISLLGRPDQNELYKRNEKFFKYFLEPGPTCGSDSSGMILSVRFNSVGLAKETTITVVD